MSVSGPAYQKGVMLTESEDTAFVWTRQYFEIDLHYDFRPNQLPLDLEIIKGHIDSVAGVEAGEAPFVILSVCYVVQILAVDVELPIGALDPYFQLVGICTRSDRTRFCSGHDGRLVTGLVHDDLILRFGSGID